MNTPPDPKDEKAMRIAYLVAGFLQQTLTPAEHEELDRWVEESDENMLLFEELTDEDNIAAGLQKMRESDTARAYEKAKEGLVFTLPKQRRSLWPYAIAASLLLTAGALYLLRSPSRTTSQPVAATQPKGDIPPGGRKALLVLDDGRKIALENQHNGELQRAAGVTITKRDSGQIAYAAGASSTAGRYNTLITPAGGQYGLTLSDGTKIWLNAASSLRYPEAFGGAERVVELTGEAYLEVAHNSAQPFLVRSAGQEVRVLGTRFNVRAYGDEDLTATTLVEGSIQLTNASGKKLLTPGQQGAVTRTGSITVRPADAEAALAWRNGKFMFRNAAIADVMKELGRWYGARVVYAGTVGTHFNGEISRNLAASKVLSLLEKTGGVHFQIEDKTITVKP